MTILDRSTRPSVATPVLVSDLLADAETMTRRLQEALRDEQWLDAYLFSAGLGQLVDDQLHADPFLLNRAARYLGNQPSRSARLAGETAGVAGRAVQLGRSLASLRLGKVQQPLTELTTRLAGQVIAAQHPGDLAPLVRSVLPALPALAGDLIRTPSCFHSFDQHPDDVKWLVAEFQRRYPPLSTPLCVVGVRTSGSYLGPLHAAALSAAGHSAVSLLTYRPGQPFLRRERTVLKATTEAGGLVLVCDDPPGTGTSLAATAREIRRAGVPDSRIVFTLSVFGSADDVPAALSAWPVVVQPWEEWSVRARLAAAPVQEALVTLIGSGTEVSDVRPLQVPTAPASRGHVRARFAVRLTDRQTGESTHKDILVEGSGVGYFGREAIAVAAALPGQVPHVYGHADGLLYRDWLPDATHSVPSVRLAGTITDYVVARRRALPAPFASTAGLGGRDPVWEVAAKLVSGQYGRLAIPARPLLLDPLMRRILSHEHPTVVDGNTDRRHWLPDGGSSGGLRKVDFHQRTFGNLDLTCYDPIFDLAGAAADPPDSRFEAELRSAYEDATDEQVDGERWLLYRLAYLWRLGRASQLDRDQVNRQSAEAVHDYLAALYLRGLPAADGAVCAIDLDGVLECDRLGYPVTSPTGVLALRALIAHGYRPVLASGRSLPDVGRRCESFGLAGGVAEYGAALYVAGAVTDLRSRADRDLLERIRGELMRWSSVQVDPQYQYAIRVRASQGPVPADLRPGIEALAGPDALIIHGHDQTDITTVALDKATGLAVLTGMLGDPGCALAVGDSPPDLSMLAQASLARAPSNARLGAGGARVRLTKGAYQSGLAEACADLLGHHPGGCPECHPPAFASRTKAMLAILDLRANGLATIGTRTAALGALMMRRDRW
jgi:hydroxymethylpyrimidine pyrophosphatase-like HAD family hydrolase